MLPRLKKVFGECDALGIFSTSPCFPLSSTIFMLSFVAVNALYDNFDELITGERVKALEQQK